MMNGPSDLPKLDLELSTTPNGQSDLNSKRCCIHEKRVGFLVILALAVIGTLGGLGAKALLFQEEDEQEEGQGATSGSGFGHSSSKLRDEIEALVGQVSDPVALLDSLSPQSRALDWLTFLDTALTSAEDPNVLQRYALMVFFFSTNGPLWALSNRWDELPGLHECNFTGIDCDPTDQLVGLNLIGRGLSGSLPEELGLLTNMDKLHLGRNKLKGSIPESIYTETINLSKWKNTIKLTKQTCLTFMIQNNYS
jgi:hypothetical protein